VFDINNPNHRLNCVKICLQGHDGSEITSINFHENYLLSGSENGMLVLWNLYNNRVFRIAHYIHESIYKTEFVNEKCFMVITNQFKIYIFKKEFNINKITKIKSTVFKCKHMIDLGIPPKVDTLMTTCFYGKELWLGTQKSRLFMIDMTKVCEQFNLNINDYFSDISKKA
jgi:WD40 repeat protein